MAGDSAGEKTEKPTPRKLRKSREKGQVAKSKECASSAVLLAMFVLLWVGGGFIIGIFRNMMTGIYNLIDMPFDEIFDMAYSTFITSTLLISFIIAGTVCIAAVAGNMVQIGFLISFESITPDLKKINPIEGFKKIFSIDNLFELVKSVVKIAFIAFVVFLCIRNAIPDLVKLPFTGIGGVMVVAGNLIKQLIVVMSVVAIVIPAVDYLFQRYRFTEKMKMTKQEVKEEHKEMEGDPHVKGRRRQLMKEMAQRNDIERTRKATVLVTNPTHLAIALFYDEDGDELPTVVAKGAGNQAQLMMDAAREEGIPVMQNIPLARDLFERGEIDNFIPRDLLKPVAEVIRWVLENRDNDVE
ncbi:MAG: flagellar biosynthesis protein FlhB [Chitinivibrionales bacterium]|nr:flagellar biosynthesis protein FlhB [Chitinivibrionales bacterium]MBD3356600.1 flagellar biosynthesis protein FlhB [Chitinivibrionales bacterium]